MIKQEQKDLAEYVKEVHLSLRRKSQQLGAKVAWEEHLKNETVLKNYAEAMKKLAEEYWSVNNQTKNNTFLCRIEWTVNYIIEYYQNESLKKEVEKESKKMNLFFKKGLISAEKLKLSENYKDMPFVRPPYKLLDVGSCYNPFGKFDFLEVYPIDLYPALPEVKKCNFLDVDIVNEPGEWFIDNVIQIPANFFDVVVFSLFLEYLPSPEQRYLACEKAYCSLKINGLLLIVTPDSRHAGANASLMKKWKLAAARIGFVRTHLEKLKYLYCMSFRKSRSRNYPLVLNNIQEKERNTDEAILIPQDFVDYEIITEEKNKTEKKVDENVVEILNSELPFPPEPLSPNVFEVGED